MEATIKKIVIQKCPVRKKNKNMKKGDHAKSYAEDINNLVSIKEDLRNLKIQLLKLA